MVMVSMSVSCWAWSRSRLRSGPSPLLTIWPSPTLPRIAVRHLHANYDLLAVFFRSAEHGMSVIRDGELKFLAVQGYLEDPILNARLRDPSPLAVCLGPSTRSTSTVRSGGFDLLLLGSYLCRFRRLCLGLRWWCNGI